MYLINRWFLWILARSWKHGGEKVLKNWVILVDQGLAVPHVMSCITSSSTLIHTRYMYTGLCALDRHLFIFNLFYWKSRRHIDFLGTVVERAQQKLKTFSKQVVFLLNSLAVLLNSGLHSWLSRKVLLSCIVAYMIKQFPIAECRKTKAFI